MANSEDAGELKYVPPVRVKNTPYNRRESIGFRKLMPSLSFMLRKAITMIDYLMHEGKAWDDNPPGRGSGRYAHGSGENPYQHDPTFLGKYERYSAKGLTEKEIAEKLCCYDVYGNPTTKALRARVSAEKASIKQKQRVDALKLYEEGKGFTEIARRMGLKNESTARSLVASAKTGKLNKLEDTANALQKLADEKRFVDISAGAENYLNTTKTNLDTAAKESLRQRGYHVWSVKIPQLGTNHQTTVTVLAPPDATYGELLENKFNVKPVYKENRVIDENGKVVALGDLAKSKIHNIDSSRVMIDYATPDGKGGAEMDGLIELRRGVDDISIGSNHYAQVRIPVNGTHYVKGMAIYSDKLPDGVDVLFHTNKKEGTPMINGDKGVLKPMKRLDNGEVDWRNPFGATVTQREYTGEDGKKHYSAANIVNQEGTWQGWHRNLSSQFASKQSANMAKRQLNLDYISRKEEFEAINALENNTLKKKLLIEFGDKCDTAAVELKAAPFPGQQSHAILPNPKIPETEIYAPNYKDGQKVVLVRHPYAGPFESAMLTVRNTGSPGKAMIGPNAPDAVVINAKVAAKMSGADFDGDTVAVIPISDKVKVDVKPSLPDLKGFDPSEAYPGYDGMEVISSQNKQTQMGVVSNLITDMTFQGADAKQIARAVKHSMVIIDSEKHELDYKRSERENKIQDLKDEFQQGGGASTLISRSKSKTRVPQRKDWSPSAASIDPVTGKKIYTETGDTYEEVKLKGERVFDPNTNRMKTVYPAGDKHGWVGTYSDKDGNLFYYTSDKNTGKKVRVTLTEDDYTKRKTVPKMDEVTKMSVADDAYELTSGGKEKGGFKIENIYADYANNCKALGNLARKTWLETKEDKKDPAAAREYAEEVASLRAKLRVAESYAPMERQAQMMGNRRMEIVKEANPNLDNEHIKKYQSQAIQDARDILGIKRKTTLIDITDREWEAIQNKAVSPTTLRRILNNTDPDKLRKRATPRTGRTLTPTMISLAKSMERAGYTNEQIAERLGFSTTSIYRAVHGDK